MLGVEVAESTVDRYMVRRRRPPSHGRRTFLRNHAAAIDSLDLFVVRTISFRLLYGLVILRHARRRLVTISVTSSGPGFIGVVFDARDGTTEVSTFRGQIRQLHFRCAAITHGRRYLVVCGFRQAHHGRSRLRVALDRPSQSIRPRPLKLQLRPQVYCRNRDSRSPRDACGVARRQARRLGYKVSRLQNLGRVRLHS